jgi:acylglycerol lipase
VFKTKRLLDRALENPWRYTQRHRLGTALELLEATREVQASLPSVVVPFFVLHGGDDVITDPDASKLLFKEAASEDKTIKIYPGMPHALLPEEPQCVVDICDWISKRVTAPSSAKSKKKK